MEINAQTASADLKQGQNHATFVVPKRSNAPRVRLMWFLEICLSIMVVIATILTATGYDDQPLIEHSPVDLPLSALLLFSLSGGALLWRRRFPVTVLFAVLAASGFAIFVGFFEGPLVAVLAGLYSVGRYVDRPDRSISALVFTLVFVVVAALSEQDRIGVLWILVQLLSVVLVWYVGRFVRVRAENRILIEEQEKHAQTRRATEAEQAVAQERTRIARDLHDIVAHHVSLMTVQAAAARTVANKDLPRAIEAMAAVEQVGREALAELRNLLGVLRLNNEIEVLDPQPGLGEVPRLVAQMRDAGLNIELQIEGSGEMLTKGTNLAIYRIIQEALTNVLKHAGPKVASMVGVSVSQKWIEIIVRDDGASSSRQPGVGHGLVGMAERASLLGGTFSAGVRPLGGYEVRVCLPRKAEPS